MTTALLCFLAPLRAIPLSTNPGRSGHPLGTPNVLSGAILVSSAQFSRSDIASTKRRPAGRKDGRRRGAPVGRCAGRCRARTAFPTSPAGAPTIGSHDRRGDRDALRGLPDGVHPIRIHPGKSDVACDDHSTCRLGLRGSRVRARLRPAPGGRGRCLGGSTPRASRSGGGEDDVRREALIADRRKSRHAQNRPPPPGEFLPKAGEGARPQGRDAFLLAGPLPGVVQDLPYGPAAGRLTLPAEPSGCGRAVPGPEKEFSR